VYPPKIAKGQNLVITNGNPIFGVHRCRVWGKLGVKLEVYVFFDPQRALNERNELFLFISKLESIVVVGGVECEKYRAKIEKYLIVRKSLRVEGGYMVNVREDVVEAELAMVGWLVLVSNCVVDV